MGKKNHKKNKDIATSYDLSMMLNNIKIHTEKVDIGDFATKMGCIYGANVNIKRYIPEIKDGLKPVWRRMLLALHDLHSTPNGKLFKSTEIDAETVKTYHPHGSIYESIVYAGQEWRNNVQLIDYHGNFGSAYENNDFAAARYTSARISEFAYDCFMTEWNPKDIWHDMTLDYTLTYTDEYLEPLYLCAKYPLFLFNWHHAMGFGKSTSTPGFNITEAVNAMITLMDNPDAKIRIYPDDPKGCTITNKSELKNILDYKPNDKNKMTIKVKGNYHVEVINEKVNIVITSVPFEVSPLSVEDNIVDLVHKGLFPEISNICGDSAERGKEFTIKIELHKGCNPVLVMDKIYKKTKLQSTFSVRYAFVDGYKSRDYTLRIAILEWLRYRRSMVKRLKKIKLSECSKRIHMLQGILYVIDHNLVDDVIHIIRKNTKDEAIKLLMQKIGLTDYQAEKFLDMKLSQLSSDNYDKFKKELLDLSNQVIELRDIILDNNKINKIIKSQLLECAEKYGEPRKSKVIDEIADRKEIEDIDYILVFTEKYIKKMTYNSDGYKIGKIDANDKIKKIMIVNNRNDIALFTIDGRVHIISVSEIPESSTQVVGLILSQFGVNSLFADAIEIDEGYNGLVSSITKNGFISNTDYNNLIKCHDKKDGYQFMNITKDDELRSVILCKPKNKLIVFTKNGKATIFAANDFETTAMRSKGVIAIKLDASDEVNGISAISDTDTKLLVSTDRAFMKTFPIKDMPDTNRKDSGIEVNSGNGNVIAIIPFNNSIEVMYGYTNDGAFEFDPYEIKSAHRIGKNTRVINLTQSMYLVNIQK